MSTLCPFGAGMSKIDDCITAALFSMFLIGSAFAGDTPPVTGDGDSRRSTSRLYEDGGREKTSDGVVTEGQYEPLITDGKRTPPRRLNGAGKPGESSPQSSIQSSVQSSTQSFSDNFWIYYADVQLFHDDDGDGYFHGVDVLFDADTYFEAADVYAVLYLSLEGGPWNEYAVTDAFQIFGATSDDEYVVVTELDSGYPRGSYDLLIELYDAADGAYLAVLGPIDTSELGLLPLEDFNRDDPLSRGPGGHAYGGGGGAMDLTSTALLSLFVAVACIRRRKGARFI